MHKIADMDKVIRRTYRPTHDYCPMCYSVLKRSHIVCRKHLITLNGTILMTSWGYRCSNPNCEISSKIYYSKEAEALHLPKRQFGRDLIVHVGYRRFWYHQTVYEIHDWLTKDMQVKVSQRQILNLITDFLALLVAGQPAKVEHELKPLKEVVIGLDGMQPQKGNVCLYIARELTTNLTLLAKNLADSSEVTIQTQLLQPLKQLIAKNQLTWYGVVSDAQETLRRAIVKELPLVPYQACHSHCLRKAGEPTFNADRNMKKRLKASFRKRLKRLIKQIDSLPEEDPFRCILTDYADAMSSTLLQGGVAPFELGGLRVFDDLSALAGSLARCQQKGQHRFLVRLLKIADCRLAFTAEVKKLRQQRQWLIELEHLLDPSKHDVSRTSQQVIEAVNNYLNQLLTGVSNEDDTTDCQVARHINSTFRHRWWGLFTCYDYEDLPRTNNALEQFIRRIKTGHRRITGRKNEYQVVIRYGPAVTYVDYRESVNDLLLRLSEVNRKDFLRERQTLETTLLRERKRHQFRCRQVEYLCELEKRWIIALEKTS